MDSSVTIRPVRPDDAAALAAIYRPYVESTAITFEYTAPSADEFVRRIAATTARYPYLVAVDADGTVLGYAYAGTFKGRAAYDWSVELSIYVQQGLHRHGLGRALYAALEERLTRMHVTRLYACLADPPVANDPYLDDASRRFHAHLGYQLVGTFRQCAYKFDRWYDMIWMEKKLGEATVPAAPFQPWDGR